MKAPSPRKAKRIGNGCLLAALPIVWIAIALESPVLGCLAILISVAGMVIDLFFYGCPHCGSHLGGDSCEYCKHCGEKIE